MTGPSLILVEGLVAYEGAGSHCYFEVRGEQVVGVVRALRFSNGSVTEQGAPDIRRFPTADLLMQVGRCLPDLDVPAWADDEMRIPWEVAAALAGDPAGASASYARSALGWTETPDPLASVLGGIRGDALMSVESGAGVSVRRYVYGDAGWMGLSVEDQQLVMTLVSRDEIPRRVTCDVAAAIALTMAGHRRG